MSNLNKNTTSSPKSSQSPSKKVTVVAGDSILKHVEGWRLSNTSNHVVVKSFSGATTSDMEDYLRPVLRKKFCIEKNWGFLDHESFNSTCLNSRGLHLNRKGTSILARNISKYISTD